MLVIVKQNGSVVDKLVYSGDDQKAKEMIDQRISADSDLEFDVYKDSDIDVFNSIKIDVRTQEQLDWEKVKGDTALALSFLAKKLGLE